MRYGIGLLSLLIGVAIILMVSFSGPKGGYVTNTLQKGGQAKSEAEQIAGVDPNGGRVMDSIQLDAIESGGRFRGFTVTSLVTGGAMQTIYGLVVGDEIVGVGPFRFRDSNNDVELSRAQVWESSQRNMTIDIVRNGQPMTLQPNGPLSRRINGAIGTPAGTPAGIQQQLNQIPGVTGVAAPQ